MASANSTPVYYLDITVCNGSLTDPIVNQINEYPDYPLAYDRAEKMVELLSQTVHQTSWTLTLYDSLGREHPLGQWASEDSQPIPSDYLDLPELVTPQNRYSTQYLPVSSDEYMEWRGNNS